MRSTLTVRRLGSPPNSFYPLFDNGSLRKAFDIDHGVRNMKHELEKELAAALERLAADPDNPTLKRIIQNRQHDLKKLPRAVRPAPAFVEAINQPSPHPNLTKEVSELYPHRPLFARTGRYAQDRKPAYGGEKPLPETRPEILDKYLDQVTGEGVAQIHYAHSDVTSGSLLISGTKAGVEDRSLDLEVPQNTYFFDPSWGVYWRGTG